MCVLSLLVLHCADVRAVPECLDLVPYIETDRVRENVVLDTGVGVESAKPI